MPVDSLHRCAYRVGHLLARQWWRLRRPHGRGVAVAVWWRGRLLVVRPSYRRGYDLPGGGLDPREEPRRGAVRELAEELALDIPPAELQELGLLTFTLEHRRIEETLFAWQPAAEPVPRIDRREIVWAGFVPPAALDGAAATPSVRHALRRRPALTTGQPSPA
jgi:8-oxo-dGTP pyrophosphatase MutT (NUDIX family)